MLLCTEAPFRSRNRTSCSWPPAAANCSPVLPASSVQSTGTAGLGGDDASPRGSAAVSSGPHEEEEGAAASGPPPPGSPKRRRAVSQSPCSQARRKSCTCGGTPLSPMGSAAEPRAARPPATAPAAAPAAAGKAAGRRGLGWQEEAGPGRPQRPGRSRTAGRGSRPGPLSPEPARVIPARAAGLGASLAPLAAAVVPPRLGQPALVSSRLLPPSPGEFCPLGCRRSPRRYWLPHS